MRCSRFIFIILPILLILSSCSQGGTEKASNDQVKIGLVLTDNGLGDQSFNDSAFKGLMKARDELGLIFDYRDLNMSKNYEQALTELVHSHCNLIIGLGFTMVEDFTKVAKKFPNQQFVFIDEQIDLPNVTSITFKEEEGSYVVGMIAGLRTKSNTVGFIGGMDVPIINRFKSGFTDGVKTVNPDATVLVDYANDFGKPEIGRSIAKKMIKNHADVIYPAAGLTGVGAIDEAAKNKLYAIGVDSDQFFIAEKTVLTSMLKNVDIAVYTVIQSLIKNGSLKEKHMILGLKENGVSAAPMRILPLSPDEMNIVEANTKKVLDGEKKISIE